MYEAHCDGLRDWYLAKSGQAQPSGMFVGDAFGARSRSKSLLTIVFRYLQLVFIAFASILPPFRRLEPGDPYVTIYAHLLDRDRCATMAPFQPRLRVRSLVLQGLEDYERYGQSFYRLAARDAEAHLQDLDQVLATLSEHFILAEKPLAFLSDRYLSLHKHRLFEL